MAKGALTLDVGKALGNLLRAVFGVFGASRRVVTVDIDSTTIRLMETKGSEVKKWSSMTIEPAEVEGEAALDPKTLSKLIKQAMTSSGIKAQKVIASFSGLYSVNRILPMSSLPVKTTMQEAVLETARETLPLSEEKLYLFWQTLPPGKDEQPRVMVLGVPRSSLDYAVRALKMTGVSPRLVELRAMALARAVDKPQALILNIEPASFDIIIVVNGVPEIMRTIPWKPGELTVEDKVEHLALTLGLTEDFYHSRHPDSPLEANTPLFITGQMSGDLTLVEKLKARLKYPVAMLAPTLQYPEHLPISQYAVNFGLTRKGVSSRDRKESGHSFDMNLLPETYRPWRPSARQVLATLLVVLALALVLPVFETTTKAMNETAVLQSKFIALDAQLQAKKLEIQKREPLQKAITDYNQIIRMGGNFAEDLRVIQKEADKLGIKVEFVSHKGSEIEVDGEADSYLSFRQYITALEKSGRFATPIPPPEGYPYTTTGTIKLKPKGAEPPKSS